MIGEDSTRLAEVALGLLRRGRTSLDTRDRAVLGGVRIVQPIFLI